MFVKPGVIKDDFVGGECEGEEERLAFDRAVRFFRSVGFRKVGCSKWFYLAVDEGHGSRRVLVEEDLGFCEEKSS